MRDSSTDEVDRASPGDGRENGPLQPFAMRATSFGVSLFLFVTVAAVSCTPPEVACETGVECSADAGTSDGTPGIQVSSAAPNRVCILGADSVIVCSVLTAPTGSGFSQVVTSFAFACGLRDDGTVDCPASVNAGQVTLEGTFVSLTAGGGFAGGSRAVCGLSADATLACAGGLVTIPEGEIAAASVSGQYLCVIGAGTGAVQCVGEPELFPPPGSFSEVSVAQGIAGDVEAHACGIRSEDASIVCWGSNTFGESDPPTGAYRGITVGRDHGCAIRDEDDAPVCWGANDRGQASPPPELRVAQLSAAVIGFTCSVTLDSNVVCWGVTPELPSAE